VEKDRGVAVEWGAGGAGEEEGEGGRRREVNK